MQKASLGIEPYVLCVAKLNYNTLDRRNLMFSASFCAKFILLRVHVGVNFRMEVPTILFRLMLWFGPS